MSKKIGILTKEFLYQEYIVNKKPMLQIAKENNCGNTTICRALSRNGIKSRTVSEALIGKCSTMNPNYKGGYCLKTYYCKDCLKKGIKTKISLAAGVYGTGLCKPCASKIRFNGKNHPCYIENLIREYPVEFNKILKEAIRQRDNHQCQICGKTQLENTYKLSVHHIDYIKNNLNPNNLITLCKSCHMKTNYNRETYIEFFKILKETLNV